MPPWVRERLDGVWLRVGWPLLIVVAVYHLAVIFLADFLRWLALGR